MKTLTWAGMVMAVLALLVFGTTLLAQAPPPDEDMEWLEGGIDGGAGPGPGAGPGAGPGPANDRPDRPDRADRPDRPDKGERGRMENMKDRVLDRIKRDDPDRFQRIQKIKDLADKYRETEDEQERAKIEKDLRPLVEQELKVQQEENQARIARLEKKLAHWKNLLVKREEHWDEVVDFTVKDITGQNDYLKVRPGDGDRRKK